MSEQLVKDEALSEGDNDPKALVNVQKETRGIIHGVVKDWNGMPAKDAVVKLYEIPDSDKEYALNPIAHIFADEYGEFVFGPLDTNKKYAVKVWFKNAKVKQYVVTPDKCCEKSEKYSSTAINEQGKKNENMCDDNRSPLQPDDRNDCYYDDYGHDDDEEGVE